MQLSVPTSVMGVAGKRPSSDFLCLMIHVCLHAQVFVGLLARDHLMVLLRRVMARGLPAAGGGNDDIAFEDLSRHYVSAAARSLILEQQLAVLQARGLLGSMKVLICRGQG